MITSGNSYRFPMESQGMLISLLTPQRGSLCHVTIIYDILENTKFSIFKILTEYPFSDEVLSCHINDYL